MIIFFNVKKLANQLRENTVPEVHQFLYLMLPFLIDYVGGNHASGGFIHLFFSRPGEVDLVYTLDLFFDATVTVGGTYLAWKINQNGDGKDFIKRFIVLCFPAFVFVNITGFMFPFARGFYLSTFASDNSEAFYELNKLIITVGFNINRLIYYSIVLYGMKLAAKTAAVKHGVKNLI